MAWWDLGFWRRRVASAPKVHLWYREEGLPSRGQGCGKKLVSLMVFPRVTAR